ncbi:MULTISPECIES: 50S ribosomal protein L30 [Actinocorallia]|uniref:Large ribosomal subunit protein uL30 n=1 Tax=Actinocorallia libanotica TaxID=46162 RepID=A0ABN1RN21_9ACTN|nr:50S ribosomal protein L30 [Actinocorallia populi]
MTQLKITQIKSVISEKQNQRDSLRTLGLKKIGQSVVREDKPEVVGLIRTVAHLVKVEEVQS